jgi:hypothetical protein
VGSGGKGKGEREKGKGEREKGKGKRGKGKGERGKGFQGGKQGEAREFLVLIHASIHEKSGSPPFAFRPSPFAFLLSASLRLCGLLICIPPFALI